MATTKKESKGASLTGGQKIGIGVGVTATMLAAVGGYFLYGAKDAKKNRTKVGSWMLKAKAEVLEGIENAKELSEADYDKLVDDVMKGYKAARSASAKDLGEFAGEMKNHWKKIKSSGPEKKVSIPVVSATHVKKTVKKAPKK
jgi:hypothetical protein